MTTSVYQLIIEPEGQSTQARISNVAPDPVVPSAIVSVKGTDANTDGAVGILIDPEFETLFRIYRPLGYTDQVGAVVNSCRWFFERDGLGRTTAGTAIANIAEGFHPEFFRLAVHQRQIGEDTAQTQARPIFFSNQQTVAPDFAKPGLDRQWNRQR